MAQVSKAKHNYYYEGKRIKMNIQTRKDDDTITTCVLKYKLKTQTTNTIIVPNSGVSYQQVITPRFKVMVTGSCQGYFILKATIIFKRR